MVLLQGTGRLDSMETEDKVRSAPTRSDVLLYLEILSQSTAATRATLNNIHGLAPDGSGGYYIADTTNAAIRRIFAN